MQNEHAPPQPQPLWQYTMSEPAFTPDPPAPHYTMPPKDETSQDSSQHVDEVESNVQNVPVNHVAHSSDRWHIHWRTPCSILGFFLLGVASALAHHFYYASLDGEPPKGFSQEWAVRIGTGLAFLTKACLVASAAIAYQQYYWTVLRNRPLNIQSIDDVMGLLGDPTRFMNLDMLKNAWFCAVLAAIIWCIPLSAIAPPASLTVGISVSEQTAWERVPNVDWSEINYAPTNGQSSFSDAGQETYRIVTATLFSNAVLPMTPSHQNVSYSITFPGPRLRCTDVESVEDFDGAGLNGGSAVIHYNTSRPSTFEMLFWTPQRNFTCRMWNATYDVKFSFLNGVQSSQVTNVRLDREVVAENIAIGPGYGDVPEILGYAGWYRALSSVLGGVVYQTGVHLTLVSTSKVLQTPLAGCTELEGVVNVTSAFVEQECPGSSLDRGIEALSEMVMLSFFGSIPSLYYRQPDGSKPNMTYTDAQTTTSTTTLVYFYNRRSLLLSYFVAVGVCFAILVAGFYALWSNGVSHNSSFSGILCTTRNAELDDIAEGHWLGSQPLSDEIQNHKLQFGNISDARQSGARVEHPAFGVPAAVVKLRKGQHILY